MPVSQTCETQITVIDTTPPEIVSCPDLNAEQSDGTVMLDFASFIATDNCEDVVVSTPSDLSYDCDNRDIVRDIEIVFTDSSGNSVSCNPTIIIIDGVSESCCTETLVIVTNRLPCHRADPLVQMVQLVLVALHWSWIAWFKIRSSGCLI